MPTGPDGIPSGWTENEYDGFLFFEAKQANSTVGMTHHGTNTGDTKPTIYISSNKSAWTQWDYTTITLDNVGDRVYMYGNNPNGIGRSSSNYSKFTMSGQIAAGGDCTTLLDIDGTTSVPTYAFVSLFVICTSLFVPPELPATTLSNNCYQYMFQNCTNLATVPKLPAMVIASRSYSEMFFACTSLTTAPELPATTLGSYCYHQMFRGCTNLVVAPELPATTLANYCYGYMFYQCINLTIAPELQATVLKNDCYTNMFNGCTNLTTAPELPATTLVQNCYNNMFYGCTNLNNIKVDATSWNSSQANNWVYGVSPTGDFYCPQSLQIGTGTSAIPSGWTRHDV